VNVLGIETSCDETAVAVVQDGRRIISNVIASQVELHARYGGVVPELASRQHLEAMIPTLEEALERARCRLCDLDAVAVTIGPGLAGALLVGTNFAKAFAYALSLPLIAVNHLEAHIYAAWLDSEREPLFPALCLTVSGGHSDVVLMESHGCYRRLGQTVDDAAGEAFDKVARLLGLGFPGRRGGADPSPPPPSPPGSSLRFQLQRPQDQGPAPGPGGRGRRATGTGVSRRLSGGRSGLPGQQGRAGGPAPYGAADHPLWRRCGQLRPAAGPGPPLPRPPAGPTAGPLH